MRQAGRLFYVISPEIHGFDAAARTRRWQDFKSWQMDGICTDYPLAAKEFCLNLHVKNTLHKLDDFTKGWFVGNFSPTILPTDAVEVAVKHYRAGEAEGTHHHKVATELTLIVSGRVRMSGEEVGPGEIIRMEPGQATDFVPLADTVTVVVKLPCVKGDKISMARKLPFETLDSRTDRCLESRLQAAERNGPDRARNTHALCRLSRTQALTRPEQQAVRPTCFIMTVRNK